VNVAKLPELLGRFPKKKPRHKGQASPVSLSGLPCGAGRSSRNHFSLAGILQDHGQEARLKPPALALSVRVKPGPASGFLLAHWRMTQAANARLAGELTREAPMTSR